MDQVASFEELRDQLLLRVKGIAYYIDKVQPRIDLYYEEVYLKRAYSEEEKQEAHLERRKLQQLVANCEEISRDYSWTDGANDLYWDIGVPKYKKQTKKEAEQGIDALLNEMLTYEYRCPLAIWKMSFWDRKDLEGFGGPLYPYYEFARKWFPEVAERETARKEIKEKIRLNRQWFKQAD